MFFLFITILQNIIIASVFKLFTKYNVNILQAVVVNYCVCVLTGIVFIGHSPFSSAGLHAEWLPWSVIMGSSFIPLFVLIAYCTKVDGITTTTIANKLSLAIPVLFSVFLYNEQLSALKVAGILLAFPAVYYTTRIKEANDKPQGLFLPALLFLCSGLLDTFINYLQRRFLNNADVQAAYTIHVFATAAFIGIVTITILALLKRTQLHWRNVVAGICLGIPNFFSIYFFIRFLNSGFMHSSAAIPVLNIGILMASTLTAILFFKEKLSSLRILGLVLSVMAILFIAYGDR
jgi:drug/metabolite transporter (DMT)-like permease